MLLILPAQAVGAEDPAPDSATPPASNDTGEGVKTLPPVVVTATRIEQSSFDLPVSIDRINRSAIQSGQPMVNLSESLVRVPGIVAQNRQNHAQDLQISSRGFGA
ncbi:MAG: TonB-dependent receptor plug domain-containing protein, partial [Noviherbaspirillum sp.]